MAFEKWIGVVSIALFAMFAGEMISIYNFMANVPEDFRLSYSFEADPKLAQFISIGAAPAGVMAGVAYVMSRHYGSKQIGFMLMGGGAIMFVGMYICFSMIPTIDEQFRTDTVKMLPILFMILSMPTIVVGARLTRLKKKRPKKEYF